MREEIALAVSIVCFIGCIVTIAVEMVKRKRSRK